MLPSDNHKNYEECENGDSNGKVEIGDEVIEGEFGFSSNDNVGWVTDEGERSTHVGHEDFLEDDGLWVTAEAFEELDRDRHNDDDGADVVEEG